MVRPNEPGHESRLTESVNDVDGTDNRPGNGNGRGTIPTVQRKKRCDSCGKYFAGDRGVNIHKGKMHKVSSAESQNQRSQDTPRRKTRENSSPETHHSTQELRVTVAPVTPIPDNHPQDKSMHVKPKPKLQWPPATDKRWKELDDDLEVTLNAALRGSSKQKIEKMTTIVFSMCETRFGSKGGKKENKGKAGPSRRQRKIAEIRKELRLLKHRWKYAADSEKDGLKCLRDDLRKNLMSQRRAENIRKKAVEKKKARRAFFQHPFKFVSDLLGKPKSGILECSVEEAEQQVNMCHSDPLRDEPLEECPNLIPAPVPHIPFDDSDFKINEVREVVRHGRAASAPGPSGTSYAVYKHCPKLFRRLWKLLNGIWKAKDPPRRWSRADGCFIPKELNSKTLDQFREISLLDVEGKIFWAIIARRMNKFLLQNQFIDTSVQKGGVAGIPGCLEHTATITQLITEAKKSKKNLSVVWLDLEKAYPSVPHKLIEFALAHYHFPEALQKLVKNHFDTIVMRFRVGREVTRWQRLEKGIMAGCTVSVVLFVIAMNIIITAAESECRGPITDSGVRHSPCKAFMDDITVMTPSVIGTRWVLGGLEKMTRWARLRFKPQKSRSLTIVKGKVHDQRFTIGGELIPTIQENPIKCLGKRFDDTLGDLANADVIEKELRQWLRTIDESSLQGKHKAWCFQFGIIPRLQWPFLLYDLAMTKVEKMERLISKYIRKWFGLPPSASSANMYSRKSVFPNPLSSAVEEYKAAKTRAIATLKFSEDDKVTNACKSIGRGQKWKAQEAVDEATSILKHKDVVGIVCVGRQGLGNYGESCWADANPKKKREMLVSQIRESEEESRQLHVRGLRGQGAWLRWENTCEKHLAWTDIWQMEEAKLRYILKSVFDLLPSPANLAVWGLKADSRCTICGDKYGSLQHILSACKKSLAEGRYRWRHDQVLKTVACCIEKAIRGPNKISHDKGKQSIQFVKEGSEVKSRRQSYIRKGLLQQSPDWQLMVDLGRQLRFPSDLCETSLRPDIVIRANAAKRLIIAELTVPWEDRLDVAHELKAAKYAGLVDAVKSKGWQVNYFPIEVGARGFTALSLRRMFIELGLSSLRCKQALRSVSSAAEDSSRWLWLRREQPWVGGGNTAS